MNRILATTFSAVALAMPSHAPAKMTAFSGAAYTGRVADARTGAPIENATVVAKWIGTVPANHSSGIVCYRVETALTDAAGAFTIGPWRRPIDRKGDISWIYDVSPLHVETLVFKPGYRDPYVTGRVRDPMQLRLEPIARDEQSIDALLSINNESACDAGPRANRIPLARALVDEAMAIESRGNLTSQDRWALDALLYGADELQLGNVEARRRQRERLAKEKLK